MEKQYILTVKVDGKPDVITIGPWDRMIHSARSISAFIAQLGEWTRHNAITGVISHLDYYADLYNEGSVVLEEE